ncbi:MAG: MmcQ/YjbR family DNA-binding protein [Pseudomonadota bacterium]
MPHLQEVVRAICTNLPETEEVISHGSPDYRVRGKTFATFTVNHHGDGRLALNLNASPETQQHYVSAAPNIFFVPAYVGPKGWYGIDLASGIRWERVAELATEAYCRVAPAQLARAAIPLSPVPEPDTVDITRIDPFFAPANQALLARLREICLALPETSEGASFGSPAFKAGKKTFCEFGCSQGIPAALFKVGPERQASLTLDPRFSIPPYMGPNGWIRLRLDKRFDEAEIRALALESYRHFALKRMLKALGQ